MSDPTPPLLIHLLYVPTLFCNLGCRYCYLGAQTDANTLALDRERALSTLQYAVDKLQRAGVRPFNISLHGGEVTTLPGPVLAELFRFIRSYYQHNQAELQRHGFHKSAPHLKTNLYNFPQHYDLLVEHGVSISASIDLPLCLHEKYRTSKSGTSTLTRSLDNIRLLATYPHKKKMSAVLYQEHVQQWRSLVSDIWRLHREYGMDMNNFNFMFGFTSALNKNKYAERGDAALHTVTEPQQVEFYQQLQREFLGTELSEGFTRQWFEEFTPSYCTNCFNCGEKFFLLQSDGTIYSCVRGQGTPAFHYGNIFQHSVAEILENAREKIVRAHRSVGMAPECQECGYLGMCHTGCPYVKGELQLSKSYTCALQKELYRSEPELYPEASGPEQQAAVQEYVVEMHPQLITSTLTPLPPATVIVPSDLYEEKNCLAAIIAADKNLGQLYGADSIYLEVNGKISPLASQILKGARTIFSLGPQDRVTLHLRKSLFRVNCPELVRNKLVLMFLRDTKVVYGDEQRTKQEHTYNFEIYYNILQPSGRLGAEFFGHELTMLLRLLQPAYQEGVLNNLFVTTSYLRDYHYEKQKNNGFYHVQAINLPFQNLEFYWEK